MQNRPGLLAVRKQNVHLPTTSELSCNVCDFRSKCRQSLREHTQNAHGEKKLTYACDQCDFQAPSRSSRIDHFDRHHSTVKKYVCSMCTKAYQTRSGLYKHKLTHSAEAKNRYPCSICDYTSYCGEHLIDHLARHLDG